MNVLILFSHRWRGGRAGGAETYATNLIKGLAAKGHSIVFVTGKTDDGCRPGLSEGVSAHFELPFQTINPLDKLKTYRRLDGDCRRTSNRNHPRTPPDRRLLCRTALPKEAHPVCRHCARSLAQRSVQEIERQGISPPHRGQRLPAATFDHGLSCSTRPHTHDPEWSRSAPV